MLVQNKKESAESARRERKRERERERESEREKECERERERGTSLNKMPKAWERVWGWERERDLRLDRLCWFLMNLASSSFHGVAISCFARAYCVLIFSFHVMVVASRCWILIKLASSTFHWFAISGCARACCMLSAFFHVIVVFGLCIRYIIGPQPKQHLKILLGQHINSCREVPKHDCNPLTGLYKSQTWP